MPDLSGLSNQILPILLLIFFGQFIRRIGLLSMDSMEDMKKLVVQVALPSILFLSFMDIRIESRHLGLAVIIFALCVMLVYVGHFLGRMLSFRHRHTPYMFSGFEYGMIGIGLFGSAYGVESIVYIAVVDLGHEFFIWFVYAPMLMAMRDGRQPLSRTIASFVRSPIIIAIVSGLVLGYFGLKDTLVQAPVSGAFMKALEYLGAMTIPLILLVVGYGMRLETKGLGRVLAVVLLRGAIMIPLALVLNRVLIHSLLGLDQAFETALFILMILPPPFICPLFIPPEEEDNVRFINNVLTVHTIFSIVVFTIYLSLVPTLPV